MSFGRQPLSFSRRSIQSRATLTSRRPMTARTPSAVPAAARSPPPTPPRRAPNIASAVPHATAIQRSWSYAASCVVRLGLSHTLLSLRGAVRFIDPSDMLGPFESYQHSCQLSEFHAAPRSLHKACPAVLRPDPNF